MDSIGQTVPEMCVSPVLTVGLSWDSSYGHIWRPRKAKKKIGFDRMSGSGDINISSSNHGIELIFELRLYFVTAEVQKNLWPDRTSGSGDSVAPIWGCIKRSSKVIASTLAPATTPLCAIGVAIATALDQWCPCRPGILAG